MHDAAAGKDCISDLSGTLGRKKKIVDLSLGGERHKSQGKHRSPIDIKKSLAACHLFSEPLNSSVISIAFGVGKVKAPVLPAQIMWLRFA